MNNTRLLKEYEMVKRSLPIGISCWPDDESNLTKWTARTYIIITSAIDGPEGSPYEGGTFELKISIPNRYPFEPPVAYFVTQIYHCNIDDGGRICLDVLKMPPKVLYMN
jgi:ubiquitin-conjugating enzyme E2 T